MLFDQSLAHRRLLCSEAENPRPIMASDEAYPDVTEIADSVEQDQGGCG